MFEGEGKNYGASINRSIQFQFVVCSINLVILGIHLLEQNITRFLNLVCSGLKGKCFLKLPLTVKFMAIFKL